MKKKCSFVLLAVIPLLFFSCSKQGFVQEPEEPVSSVIDPWLANPVSEFKTEPGTPVTLSAGTMATKTHIDENAKVIWDAGDQFEMYCHTGGFWYKEIFSTSTAGERVNFTTASGGVPSSVKAYSFYAPLSVKEGGDHVWRTSDENWGFGLKIPTKQTATENGVARGLNFSYAQSADKSDNLYFRNMLALVRIRMKGSIVSSVKSVTLQGATNLAGDCVMIPAADGTPMITFSKDFSGDVSSRSVTLTGTFEAEKDYYFAVAPSEQASFSLIFSDGSGNSTTKIATKPVTFVRGAINTIPEINLGDAFTDSTPDMSTIKWTSASAGAAKPVTIAVIPDGFTASEMKKYEMLAYSAMNTLFNVEPFKTYKNYFNVYILKVASNESGARISDGTLAEQTRDCYFESTWGKTDYDNMAANEAIISSFVSTKCPDITGGLHTINEVPILVIINDARYGGRCHAYSSGFSYCMAPYTYEGGGLSWSYPDYEAVSDSDPSLGAQPTPADRLAEVGSNSGNWLNTMLHEFGGHCFSRLSDEYWDVVDKGAASYIDTHRWDNPPYNGVAYGLNVSATYANPGYDNPGIGDSYIKEGWQHLLDKAATLPNTDIRKARIGRFQGGGVSILNRWRSERISCMIDNRFYFSTFQRELIVKRIMTLAGESFNFDSFWNNDVAVDPVRDVVSSPVMGLTDPVPPRPMPLLPPPVFHTDW